VPAVEVRDRLVSFVDEVSRYASSMPQTGDQMFALDGKTGEILWRFSRGSSVNSGPSGVDGTVYWGSG